MDEHQKIVKDTVTGLINNNALPPSASNLCQKNPRGPIFYLLPKIHKEGNPGRPIVSTTGCPTELISQYLDGIFSPLVSRLSTYVKDSSDALRIFETVDLPPTGPRFLFTMDVSSLYTNIPMDEGLRAIKHFLHRFPSPDRPDDTTILRLTELVLKLSFQFDGKFYLQKKGVAMGTKMGPSYACLFVGLLEQEILESFQGPKPLLLKRYIDDYIGIASCPLDQLKELISHFNSFHPSLRFTHDISEKTISFLDIELSIDGSRTRTSVHYIPTDAHCYLNYHSSHPPSCKRSIPFSQLSRLRRLCSEDHDFKERSREMTGFFRQRGYPVQTVSRAAEKVSTLSRREVMEPKHRQSKDRVPLVFTYHPSTEKVVSAIMDNTHLLEEDASTNRIFTEAPLVAYRKDRSLRDLLVHSQLSPLQHTREAADQGTYKCNRRRCNTCQYVSSGTFVKGPKSTWHIKNHFTCTTTNIIYAITCTACDSVYVGETKRRLADRITEHLRSIRLNTPGLPVAHHFNLPGHSLENVKVCGLMQCPGATDEERKLKEERIIYRLGCLQPNGMNVTFRSF